MGGGSKFFVTVSYIIPARPEGIPRNNIRHKTMTDSVETLVWDYILSHSISGLGEIVDGEPRLVFHSPRFARLFYRLFASDARWRWGLIDLGYFNTIRVITMQEYRVRFAPRLDDVAISAFHTCGVTLMYEELSDLQMDTTTDSDGY